MTLDLMPGEMGKRSEKKEREKRVGIARRDRERRAISTFKCQRFVLARLFSWVWLA